jgi:hypothetical protein
MRHDINVSQSLPRPLYGTVIDFPQRGNKIAPRREARKPHRITLTGLHFRLKFDYFINLHPQAKWYHKIDHSRTVAYFYPADWDGDNPNSFTLWEVRSVCGKDLDAYWWFRRNVSIGDKTDAEDSDLLPCQRCFPS